MTGSIDTRESDWTTLLLTCGKCARKLGGGFGHKERETLRSCLRDGLKAAGRRHDTRLVETRCLGICPKRAVVALNAGRPGTLVIVKQGAQAAEALQALGAD
jgi:predicted metal-binding protein